jgi:hypothetical protein
VDSSSDSLAPSSAHAPTSAIEAAAIKQSTRAPEGIHDASACEPFFVDDHGTPAMIHLLRRGDIVVIPP